MHIYRVIGHVTCNQSHPSLQGGRLLAAVPAGMELVGEAVAEELDTIVVWDDLGAAVGSLIAVSDGAEAAQPFRPALKPIDAYCSAILDQIYIPKSTTN
jgi:microcompartment protein CcmK/EutM